MDAFETKRESLRKLFDEAHSRASSIVAFTVQWKDVDSQLASAKEALLEQARELSLREKKVVETEKEIGERKEEAENELKLKYSDLEMLEKRIKDTCTELSGKENEVNLRNMELVKTQELIEGKMKLFDIKEKELSEMEKVISEKSECLDSIKSLVEEHNEELEVKEKQHDAIKRNIAQCSAQLKLKETELELLKKSKEDRSQELHSLEKKLDLVQKRRMKYDKELSLKKKTLKSYSRDIEMKEREFNAIRSSIEDLNFKENQLRSVHISIEECTRELKTMREEKASVQESIGECSQQLSSIKKKLDLARKNLKEFLDIVECKGMQLFEKFHKMLEVKEKHFDSLIKMLQARLENCEMKERQFEEHLKVFELKEQQIDSTKELVDKRCKELELKLQEKISGYRFISSLSEIRQCCITGNGRDLQLLLNELLSLNDQVHQEVSTAFKNSIDPAKLVLDVVKGFYPLHCYEEDMNSDLNVTRRSCIFLLEQLLQISPEIRPQVRDEATKLAEEWKAKIRPLPEKSLEVLSFLQLVASFQLTSTFSKNELKNLLDAVAQKKQAPELYRALGIADSLPGTIFSSQVRTEQKEHEDISNPASVLSRKVHASAAIDRSSEFILNECVDDHELMPNEILAALQVSPEPAKLVLTTLQASFSHHWKNSITGFSASLMRNIVLLLEQLMMVPPNLSPQVKESATKLAMYWKAKIRLDTKNSVEVLAFLLFLGTYQLVHLFKMDETIRLAGIILQHRQAPELCIALGFRDQIPYFIRHLYQGKQFIAAARFSCAFGQLEDFPPEKFLNDYLNNVRVDAWDSICVRSSKEAQHQAIDKELIALRAVLEFIVDHELQTRFVTDNIISRIAKLEKLKKGRIQFIPDPAPIIRSQVQGEKCHAAGSSAPGNQCVPGNVMDPQSYIKSLREMQDKSKRPRINMSTVMTYPPQFMSPVNLPARFPSVNNVLPHMGRTTPR